MSLFVHPENQNILWEMVNKLTLCNAVFQQGSNAKKEEWFKSIIQEFYMKTPTNISRNELYQLNRTALAEMIISLRELSIKKERDILSVRSGFSDRAGLSDRGTFTRLEASLEPQKTEYEIRQNQYRAMFENKKPDPIDFSEKLDDDVITNMNELIENQRKMRELEIQQYAPKEQVKEQIQKKTGIIILEDIPKEAIQSSQEKHVRFESANEYIRDLDVDNSRNEVANTENVNHMKNKYATIEYTDKIQEGITELHEKIENMDGKINKMFQLLSSIIEGKSLIVHNEGTNNGTNKGTQESNIQIIKQIMEENE